MNSIVAAIKNFINQLNSYGVPIPMIRTNGAASLTATMTFISFNTCLIGQIGRISGVLGGVDLTQANYLFGICLAAYLGRRFQGNSQAKTVDVSDSAGGQSQ